MKTGAHIREDTLVDFAEERLDAAHRARVAVHLEGGCEACATRLQELRRQLAAFRVYRTAPVPASLRERLLGAFEERTPQPSRLERLVATLKWDSRLQPALAGVRDNTGTGGSLQLLYEMGGVAVELWCEREAGAWQITGQALDQTAGELPWKVVAKGEATQAEADADDMGMFDLRGLPPGTYDLLLRDQQREIVLHGIQLGSA